MLKIFSLRFETYCAVMCIKTGQALILPEVSDHSDIFQPDTAVPERLENWNNFVTVLISVGLI